jgi:uncharacterized RDD family membrane protein YckC
VTDRSDPTFAVSQQGHYAGAVTRLAAFAVDQGVASAAFAVTTAVISWAVRLVTADEIQWTTPTWLTGLFFVAWLFLYYAYPWSVSGKTLGMALFGIRVVRRDGAAATARNGVVRALALPLSFATLGLGFLPIITGKHRRALHDLIAGTAVVYSWDARGARLRFLARQPIPTRSSPPQPSPTTPPQPTP